MVHAEIESMYVYLRIALDALSSFALRSSTAQFVCKAAVSTMYANSHAFEHVQRGLHHDQRAAIESIVRANPSASATQVWRNLGLQEKPMYVSPSKHGLVMRIAKQV